jgi:hypothetical protein
MSERDKSRITFVVFFLIWAKRQRWTVPRFHLIICDWLDRCEDPTRVLMAFRGSAKSTIYAIYKAYRLWKDPTRRNLIWAADGPLSTKLTRDTINVLRRHPLCKGMLPTKPGQKRFWVTGSNDPRNASMEAVGVDSNATGARADDIDFDDVEVPKNIKTPEARLNLRNKIEESTHILVPGGTKTYIGTPHTHDSIYAEQIRSGAVSLRVPLFQHVKRYEQTSSDTRYSFDFQPLEDGICVIAGIGKFARIMEQDADYQVRGNVIVFHRPPGSVIDICSGNAWPERFTRAAIEIKRKDTRTLNAWDSQYQLESKPVTETRLDPAKIIAYAAQPIVREVNNQIVMSLGSARIVGAVAWWDCSLGKLRSDASAFTLMLTDDRGQIYWQLAVGLTGELADFDARGKLVGGQCAQIRDLVIKHHIPSVTVETNGPGGFVPPILRRALAGLECGVVEFFSSVDKRKRILDAFEPPLSSRFLWAHVDVLEGPVWDQMKDFNPQVRDQPDDYLDSGAGAISATPVRIGKVVGKPTVSERQDWRPSAGVHEVTLET